MIFTSFLMASIINADVFINGDNITKIKDVKILELIGTNKDNEEKTEIVVKFGPQKNYLSGRGYITTKKRARIKFKSIFDALNYLLGNGWENADNYLHCREGEQTYHFFLRRKGKN